MARQRSEGWRKEVEQTRGVPGWKENLLARIQTLLGKHGGDVVRIGYKSSEEQIQFENPINSITAFPGLGIKWVQFNTWKPVTKVPGTRVVRFGPDTACLMVLVKNPKEHGEGYDWFLLANREYRLAAGQQHLIEFSRGFAPDRMVSDQGWFLFDRDFPGFRVNGQTVDIVENIFHTQLGHEVFEDTGERNNKISEHLLVVTLRRHAEVAVLKEMLAVRRFELETGGEVSYPEEDRELISEPIVYELAYAANFLNAHLEGRPDAVDGQFGENYSQSCWKHFLVLYGHLFPEILPKGCNFPV